jgi:leader peptidase (prepilin peptidase)/N-methyltransferase
MSSDGVSLLVLTILFAGVIGIFVGSFLNVVVYRAPLGLSISSPRSFCPTCRRQLSWWENIPVASWVGLRGRCHTCRVPISIRYPLVELSTGVTFALVTWAWNGSVVAAAYCVLASAALAVSLIEYGGQRSPLVVAAFGTGLALVIIVIGAGWHHHWRIVIGSLIGSAIAFAIYAVLRRNDPDCLDPRGNGRSELLVAGCWVGGLGLGPAVVGAGFWVGTYLVCMVGVWILSRQSPVSDHGPIVEGSSPPPPVFGNPLVSALGMVLVASLIAGW